MDDAKMKMYSEILAINAWLVGAFDEVDIKKDKQEFK